MPEAGEAKVMKMFDSDSRTTVCQSIGNGKPRAVTT
jgi:hypothetical protein